MGRLMAIAGLLILTTGAALAQTVDRQFQFTDPLLTGVETEETTFSLDIPTTTVTISVTNSNVDTDYNCTGTVQFVDNNGHTNVQGTSSSNVIPRGTTKTVIEVPIVGGTTGYSHWSPDGSGDSLRCTARSAGGESGIGGTGGGGSTGTGNTGSSGTVPTVQFNGSVSVRAIDWNTNSLDIAVDGIANVSSTHAAGTLAIELWFTSTPFSGGSISGWKVASFRVPPGCLNANGQLGPGTGCSSINSGTIPASPPAPATYYAVLALTEYNPSLCGNTNGGFCLDQAVALTDTVVVPEAMHGGGGGTSGGNNGTVNNARFTGSATLDTVDWTQKLATISIDGISATKTNGTTGTLKIQLWLTDAPYAGGAIHGIVAASFELPPACAVGDAQLAAGTSCTGITSGSISLTPPAGGTYYPVLTLSEYDPNASCGSENGGFCIDDSVSLPGTVVAPNVQTTPAPAPTPSPGGGNAGTGASSGGGGAIGWPEILVALLMIVWRSSHLRGLPATRSHHAAVRSTALIAAASLISACGGGTGGTAGVGSVNAVNSPLLYGVSGSVAGLDGSGLSLRNQTGETLNIDKNGTFSFAIAQPGGDAYDITVTSQPKSPSQHCAVTNGTGTIRNSAVSGVSVECTTDTFTVGGTVSGLVGTGLVLANGSSDQLPLVSNGGFTFRNRVASGTAYSVAIKTQPSNPAQNCLIQNGTKTAMLTSENATSIRIICANVGRFAYFSVATTVLVPEGQPAPAFTGAGVYAYQIDPLDGSLRAVVGNPFSSESPGEIFSYDSGKFLLLANAHGLSSFPIDASSGAIPTAGSSLDATVGTLYPACASSSGAVYAFGSTGLWRLTINSHTGAVADQQSFLVPDPVPTALRCDPSGHFIFAVNGISASMTVYALDPVTGAPTVAPGSPFQMGDFPEVAEVGFAPTGTFAFVTASADGGPSKNTVAGFAIDPATGTLAPTANGPTPAGNHPSAIVVDPSGSFLYVANETSMDLSGFAIDSKTGGLAPLSGTPLPQQFRSAKPRLIMDPSGKFLFLESGGLVSTYRIDANTGQLTPTGATQCKIFAGVVYGGSVNSISVAE